eukprot:TRINITY_DN11796_c0_g1_i3.p1 TRINITY_DN11796_c0_g1~~TRINITY_DN11796_c0_g1_i3.p1  ORF type:complete len:189 (-),score=36.86 TRINITY_DN11796_c0_g1_i3:38-580(-)
MGEESEAEAESESEDEAGEVQEDDVEENESNPASELRYRGTGQLNAEQDFNSGLGAEVDKQTKAWPTIQTLFSLQAQRGGYLPLMLQYDFYIFAAMSCLAFLGLLFRPYSIFLGEFFLRNWQFKGDIYFLKTIYGLLNFPFIIFITPFAQILLHLRPTGYNEKGDCVPLRIPIKDPYSMK